EASSDASNASSSFRLVLKPASRVSSLEMTDMGSLGSIIACATECLDEGQQLLATGFHGGLIDDQARGNLGYVLDGHQVVGAQGAAGGDEIDDGVRQSDQRRELHRAVQLDDVDVHALGREVLARSLHVFRGNPQART